MYGRTMQGAAPRLGIFGRASIELPARPTPVRWRRGSEAAGRRTRHATSEGEGQVPHIFWPISGRTPARGRETGSEDRSAVLRFKSQLGAAAYEPGRTHPGLSSSWVTCTEGDERTTTSCTPRMGTWAIKEEGEGLLAVVFGGLSGAPTFDPRVLLDVGPGTTSLHDVTGGTNPTRDGRRSRDRGWIGALHPAVGNDPLRVRSRRRNGQLLDIHGAKGHGCCRGLGRGCRAREYRASASTWTLGRAIAGTRSFRLIHERPGDRGYRGRQASSGQAAARAGRANRGAFAPFSGHPRLKGRANAALSPNRRFVRRSRQIMAA